MERDSVRAMAGTLCHARLMDVVLGRALDLEDLNATPDDGYRYEILDDAFVMTPPPSTGHQSVVVRLIGILLPAAQTLGLTVLTAPVAWRIGPGHVPEPDIVVAHQETIRPSAVEGRPVLVIEVLSPSGRGRDLYEKRRIYAEGGAAWYWIVDPDEPSLTVLRLEGDRFEVAARVVDDDVYDTDAPMALRVVPAELVRRQR